MVHVKVVNIHLDPAPHKSETVNPEARLKSRSYQPSPALLFRGGEFVRGRVEIENTSPATAVTCTLQLELLGQATVRFHEAQTEFLQQGSTTTTYHYTNERMLQHCVLDFGKKRSVVLNTNHKNNKKKTKTRQPRKRNNKQRASLNEKSQTNIIGDEASSAASSVMDNGSENSFNSFNSWMSGCSVRSCTWNPKHLFSRKNSNSTPDVGHVVVQQSSSLENQQNNNNKAGNNNNNKEEEGSAAGQRESNQDEAISNNNDNESNNNETDDNNSTTQQITQQRLVKFPPGTTILPFEFQLRKNLPGTMEIRIGSGFNAQFTNNPSEDNYGRMRYVIKAKLQLASMSSHMSLHKFSALRHPHHLQCSTSVPVAFSSPMPRHDSQLMSQTLVEVTDQELFAVRFGLKWDQVFKKSKRNKAKRKMRNQSVNSDHDHSHSTTTSHLHHHQHHGTMDAKLHNLHKYTSMRLSQNNNKGAHDGASVGLGRVLESVGKVSMALHLDQRAFAPGQGVNVTGSCAINDTREPQWLFMGIRMHAIFQGHGQNRAIGTCLFQKHQDFCFVHEVLEPGQKRYFNNATSWVLPPGMPPSFDGREWATRSSSSLPPVETSSAAGSPATALSQEQHALPPIPGGTILKWTYEFFMWMGDPAMLSASDDPRVQPIPGTTALISVPILICCQKPIKAAPVLRHRRSVHVFSKSQAEQKAQLQELIGEANADSDDDHADTDPEGDTSSRGLKRGDKSSRAFFSSGELGMYDRQKLIAEETMGDLWGVFDEAVPLSEVRNPSEMRDPRRLSLRKDKDPLSHSIAPIVEEEDDDDRSRRSNGSASSTLSLKERMHLTLERTVTPTRLRTQASQTSLEETTKPEAENRTKDDNGSVGSTSTSNTSDTSNEKEDNNAQEESNAATTATQQETASSEKDDSNDQAEPTATAAVETASDEKEDSDDQKAAAAVETVSNEKEGIDDQNAAEAAVEEEETIIFLGDVIDSNISCSSTTSSNNEKENENEENNNSDDTAPAAAAGSNNNTNNATEETLKRSGSGGSFSSFPPSPDNNKSSDLSASHLTENHPMIVQKVM